MNKIGHDSYWMTNFPDNRRLWPTSFSAWLLFLSRKLGERWFAYHRNSSAHEKTRYRLAHLQRAFLSI